MLSSLSLGAFSAPAASGASGSSSARSAAASAATGGTAPARHAHHRPRTLSTAEATALPATAGQTATAAPRGSLLDLLA